MRLLVLQKLYCLLITWTGEMELNYIVYFTTWTRETEDNIFFVDHLVLVSSFSLLNEKRGQIKANWMITKNQLKLRSWKKQLGMMQRRHKNYLKYRFQQKILHFKKSYISPKEKESNKVKPINYWEIYDHSLPIVIWYFTNVLQLIETTSPSSLTSKLILGSSDFFTLLFLIITSFFHESLSATLQQKFYSTFPSLFTYRQI